MSYGVYPSDLSNKLSVFFLRTTPGIVLLPNSHDEADLVLPQFFDFGLLNSHPLFMLNQMLTKIYSPLLSYRGADDLMPQQKQRKAIKASSQQLEQQQQQQQRDDEIVDKVDSEKAARVNKKFAFFFFYG